MTEMRSHKMATFWTYSAATLIPPICRNRYLYIGCIQYVIIVLYSTILRRWRGQRLRERKLVETLTVPIQTVETLKYKSR